MAGNGGPGIFANASAPGATAVMIDRSAAVNNLSGMEVLGDAVVRIGDSTVTGNGTGLSSGDGGQIISYQTNKIDGNGTDGTPTGTITLK